MSALHETALEYQIAEELIAAFAPEKVEMRDRGTMLELRFHKSGWKLESLILSKLSLRMLAIDKSGRVKFDYLRRDIERSSATRRRYTYPRSLRFF